MAVDFMGGMMSKTCALVILATIVILHTEVVALACLVLDVLATPISTAIECVVVVGSCW
jgi:hypothetical protein